MTTHRIPGASGREKRNLGRSLLRSTTALCLLLAACATIPPPTSELGLELPVGWTAAPSKTPAASSLPPAERWWETFDDPQLDALVAEALEHNHDLAAAAARLQVAEAQARIAGAERQPQVDLATDDRRARQNFIGFPIPGREQQVLSTTSTSLGVSLNVSWELDLWGRLRAVRRGALAELAASKAETQAARLSLAGQTAKGWFALCEAAAQTELAAATVISRRHTTERIQRRYEAGLRDALELRLARSNLAAAEALRAQRRQQLDTARRQLETLLGRYPEGTVGGEAPSALPTAPPPSPLGLPSELLSRRPDLAAAEHRLAAAGARVAESRALLYPRISLTGSAGRRSQELKDLLDSSFEVWSLAGNLLQPLFQGGRLRAGVDAASAGFLEIAEGYLQTTLRAFGEVESALAAEELLEQGIIALGEAATQARAAHRLAEDRYAAGLVDYLTVLQSQRDELLAESQLLETRRQRLDARVDLHLALGGGFAAAAPPHIHAPSTIPVTSPGD